jgi:subtilisin family serine protease
MELAVSTDPTELVELRPLMDLTTGRGEITISVIDGPASTDHPAFSGSRIRKIEGGLPASCRAEASLACVHGTYVIGMLASNRASGAPAICPGCSFMLRPVFAETTAGDDQMPVCSPVELAKAIVECVDAGTNIINLSAALVQSSLAGERQLEPALDYAAQRGVIIVAAAGNQGHVGSSAITRHPWVIPVIGCDRDGRPMKKSNLGSSIGSRGLAAPGVNIASVGSDGRLTTFDGTSAAAPFVTGAVALIWSEFPRASAARVRFAVTNAYKGNRRSIAPPLLNAWGAYNSMSVN